MSEKTSLADTAYQHVIDLYVVFSDLDKGIKPEQRSRFWSYLKPGFRHVEIWKYVPPGAWLRFDTGIEIVGTEVFAHPPWVIKEETNPLVMRIQKVIPRGQWRERFFIGPMTCVELSKAFLGISDFFMRTPYQLFKHLRKEHNGF